MKTVKMKRITHAQITVFAHGVLHYFMFNVRTAVDHSLNTLCIREQVESICSDSFCWLRGDYSNKNFFLE